jgi:transposase
MSRRRYRKFTSEFKDRAVELAQQLESISAAARKLGMSGVTLHKWVMDKEEPKKPEVIQTETPEEELKRLRKENQELKKANLILKSAAAFFSQDHLK